MKAAIIGVTGYGGGELIRILTDHPVFRIHSVHSSREGMPVTEEYPHLYTIFEDSLEKIDSDKIAAEADIVFLATPSGVSGRLAEAFSGKPIKVIDLSGDLRLNDPGEYESWYGHKAAGSNVLEKAVYGLSEWNRENIRKAEILSNPGCYPTATLLGLGPLADNGLLEPAGIIVDAKSGLSGAGKSLSKATSFTEMNENLKIYKVNEHQHIPEIQQQLARWDKHIRPITFSTHLIPVSRGIMATIYVQLKEEMDTESLVDLYKETYAGHHFVRIRPAGKYPAIKEVCGSNFCDIGMHADRRTGRLTIVSVIDNLMKGAAGQAVQNANLMFGLEENAGLNYVPVYP
ncbi:N-acetyl-gamma-glutamyl-phosphate reductase [Mesobacillus zeae]|uniref:N-acetyl-gamma-glutamyl-phosphate reductase n=1 Tax=Mesobacillus zeae TaxID=1917180 RepID=A0A398BA51_9BACI|nr:N-acetyl-gamma-glutamyl-phosphate reductase [Mesobacillus zeae]RID84553.1 N-acetyl-gamma-glutamyl-phosphate reductase [Mesobacillus zeae]